MSLYEITKECSVVLSFPPSFVNLLKYIHAGNNKINIQGLVKPDITMIISHGFQCKVESNTSTGLSSWHVRYNLSSLPYYLARLAYVDITIHAFRNTVHTRITYKKL